MREKFSVEFLPEAVKFVTNLDDKAREKIFFNIRKAQIINDSELFKKLNENIWEFRTAYNGLAYRIFAFWDKSNQVESLILATHGIIKKSNKTPEREIEKAENVRKRYFTQKEKTNG